MSLHKSMISHGHLIFRWRSYIPLLFIVPLILALRDSAHLEEIFGEREEDLWVLASFLLSLSGVAIRCFTVGFVPAGTSGRNTGGQRAHRLNTTGMYSVVRNPLYLGNFVIILGVLMSLMVWWLVLICALGFFIYMERIILAEEAFLEETYSDEYRNWRARTPVIIPDFRLWKAPEMKFSIRTVLKRCETRRVMRPPAAPAVPSPRPPRAAEANRSNSACSVSASSAAVGSSSTSRSGSSRMKPRASASFCHCP